MKVFELFFFPFHSSSLVYNAFKEERYSYYNFFLYLVFEMTASVV
jgi:hypothetical protein